MNTGFRDVHRRRRSAVAGWCLGLAVVVVSYPIVAGDPFSHVSSDDSRDIHHHVRLERFGDSDTSDGDGHWVLSQNVHLQRRTARYQSGLRLNLSMAPGAPMRLTVVDAVDVGYDPDFRLERAFLRYRSDPFGVGIGDEELALGRGILLSLRETAPGMGSVLRGVQLRANVPGRWNVLVAGGVVNADNRDPVTGLLLPDDPYDAVLALSIMRHLGPVATIGGQGVLLDPRFRHVDEVSSPERLWRDQGPGVAVMAAGGHLDLRLGGVQFYLEGNVQRHEDYRTDSLPPASTGGVVFSSVSWNSGPRFEDVVVEWGTEGIAAVDWKMEGPYRGSPTASVRAPAIRYHQMPTLEETWVVIPSPGNAAGGRSRFELQWRRRRFRLGGQVTVLQYTGGMETSALELLRTDPLAVHPLLHIAGEAGSRDIQWRLWTGARFEASRLNGEPDGQVFHGGARFELPMAAGSLLSADSTFLRHENMGFQQRAFYQFLNSMRFQTGFGLGGFLAVDYSTELIGALHQPLRISGASVRGLADVFVHGALDWSPESLPAWTVRMSGGTRRGGLICDDGYCRLHPDTIGFSLDWIVRM